MIQETSFKVLVADDTRITARHYLANSAAAMHVTMTLGHGAGASQQSPFMMRFARGLANRGIDVVTFDFVYMEQRRRIPDPAPKLEACYRAVITAVRERVMTTKGRLVVGGKSMGGRIASQAVAADKFDLGVTGLIFLGYPLHPPRQPKRLRSAHLPLIATPMLFIQGSRDSFGTPDELQPILATCQRAQLHVIEGANHAFKIKRRDIPNLEYVWEKTQDKIAEWVGRLPSV